ncbi:HNH endonuclease signature motif containing protein [Plantactinospora sp. KBS50]|uniref:HNH endonuclease signature motif containing protein n=1 Tax=Plantactinospora sp. KBS50 TaxID=2024580 RepID=UPI001E4E0587|nr:HNH endonuclease signature motif containing protein [Plantactinospora sp. KBS50]
MIDAAERVVGAARECAARPVWSASNAALIAALEAVHRAERLLTVAKLAAVREIDGRDLGRAQGATSTAGWLRDRLRISPTTARQLVADAAWMDADDATDHAVRPDPPADPGSGTPGCGVDAAGCGSTAAGCGADAAGPALRAALTSGDISLTQARIIAGAVTAARAEAGPPVADKALHALLGHARDLAPAALRVCAERILWHVAPEAAEEADRRALRRQESRAEQRRDLTLSIAAEGWLRLRGVLDAETGALLTAALDPLVRPNGPGDDRGPGQRRHDALAEVLHLALRTGELPDNGGEPPQLVITTSFDALTARLGSGTAHRSGTTEGVDAHGAGASQGVDAHGSGTTHGSGTAEGVDARGSGTTQGVDAHGSGTHGPGVALGAGPGFGVGTLDTGLRLGPDALRRLACDAAILPAVLGGRGQVLDVGRQRRLFTGPLRRALVLRDRGCAFPNCDRPPRWCAGHHIRPWTDGGGTSLHNAVLLCGYHHRVIHRGEWIVRLARDGHPEFIPPYWLDPDRTPRRNRYHLRC